MHAKRELHIQIASKSLQPKTRFTRRAMSATPACVVGLKNVGNTCWLSSSLIALLHTKAFVSLVQRPHCCQLMFGCNICTLRQLCLRMLKGHVNSNDIRPDELCRALSQTYQQRLQHDAFECMLTLVEWLDPPDLPGTGGENPQ